ncbi:MAG: PRC-barrel domain-containing protein [Phycisphaerae bacterium]
MPAEKHSTKAMLVAFGIAVCGPAAFAAWSADKQPFFCVRSAKLVDQPVHDKAGKKIGKLRDLTTDGKGKIVAGAVELEDVESPDADKTDVLVPWEAFSVDVSGNVTVVMPAGPVDDKPKDRTFSRAGAEGEDLRISALRDVKIYNQSNEHIGQINDVIVRCDEGRIEAVVMTTGGVFGTGAEKYIVPMAMFRVTRGEGDVKITSRLLKQQLQSGPKLVADSEYETKPEFFEKLARHYDVPKL